MRARLAVCCDHATVLPSRLELAWTLKNPQFKEKPLAKFVGAISKNYDLILIDCPPTESILTEAAYLASEYILVPVRPEFLSTIGLQLLARSIADFRERNESSVLKLAGIVFNSTSPTKSEHARSRKDVSNVARQHDWYVFGNERPIQIRTLGDLGSALRFSRRTTQGGNAYMNLKRSQRNSWIG